MLLWQGILFTDVMITIIYGELHLYIVATVVITSSITIETCPHCEVLIVRYFDSGDDRSAGWGYVNASDPVGIVGEYLGK